MMASLLTHKCVIRPQWVNPCHVFRFTFTMFMLDCFTLLLARHLADASFGQPASQAGEQLARQTASLPAGKLRRQSPIYPVRQVAILAVSQPGGQLARQPNWAARQPASQQGNQPANQAGRKAVTQAPIQVFRHASKHAGRSRGAGRQPIGGQPACQDSQPGE